MFRNWLKKMHGLFVLDKDTLEKKDLLLVDKPKQEGIWRRINVVRMKIEA